MKKGDTYTIGIVGRGNVGTHLHRYFTLRKINAVLLPGNTNDFSAFDVLILALPDAVLPTWLHGKTVSDSVLVLHTSGSTALEEMNHPRSGVLYPLQTFSKTVKMNYSDIHFFTESSTVHGNVFFKWLSDVLPNPFQELTSKNRLLLHCCAVMVCNFPMALFRMAQNELRKAQVPVGVLENLVTESVQKFFNHPEENTQTGPAQRKDMVTLDKHHEILKNEPEIQSIYSLLSKWIIAHRNGEKL